MCIRDSSHIFSVPCVISQKLRSDCCIPSSTIFIVSCVKWTPYSSAISKMGTARTCSFRRRAVIVSTRHFLFHCIVASLERLHALWSCSGEALSDCTICSSHSSTLLLLVYCIFPTSGFTPTEHAGPFTDTRSSESRDVTTHTTVMSYDALFRAKHGWGGTYTHHIAHCT